MWWEWVVVALFVGGSVAFLGRGAWRSLSTRTGCRMNCGGCSHSSRKKSAPAAGVLDFRTRFPPR